jgi:hypothetical protein
MLLASEEWQRYARFALLRSNQLLSGCVCFNSTDAKWALRHLMIACSGLAGVLLPDMLDLPVSEHADLVNLLIDVTDPEEHKHAKRLFYLSTGAPFLETIRLACGRSPARARKARSVLWGALTDMLGSRFGRSPIFG